MRGQGGKPGPAARAGHFHKPDEAAMKDDRAIHGAETAGMALGFLGIAIFSATLPLTRLALTSFSPGFLSAGRAAMAGLVAIPFLLARGRPLPIRDLGSVVVASACLVAGFPGFSSLAMRSLPAAHAERLTRIEEATRRGRRLHIRIAVDYSARDAIEQAASQWLSDSAGC